MILTIDQGTTSSRALIVNKSGEILGIAQKEFEQIFPQPGWVEHNPIEVWQTTLDVCKEVISKLLSEGKISKDDIKGIAITNQRETTVIWDKTTGKPIYNAIVWQCRRTADYCKELKDEILNTGFSDLVREQTGLLIDSYFSGPKIAWVLNNHGLITQSGLDSENKNADDNSPSIPESVSQQKIKPHSSSQSNIQISDLLFGTIDTWLLWNLTNGDSHFTEPSNASRTMLFDINKNNWSKEILGRLQIPESILPTVIPSNSNFGRTKLFQDLLGRDLEIKAMLGDQQAALYAYSTKSNLTSSSQQSSEQNTAPKSQNHNTQHTNTSPKITYGTGSFILIPEIKQSPNLTQNKKFNLIDGLVTSTAFQSLSGDLEYAVEGSIFIGGAVVQWLRDGLQIISSSSEIEELAQNVEDNGGVYFIPALSGLGAPHWREDIRGSIFGITRGSKQGHIARAALESIAFQVKDIFTQLKNQNFDLSQIKHINVDGGASRNDLLMQFQADLLGIEVWRYQETEMTALGASKMTELIDFELKADQVFKPQKDLSKQYQEWQSYLNKLL